MEMYIDAYDWVMGHQPLWHVAIQRWGFDEHQTLYLRLELNPENERLSEGGMAGNLGWIVLAIPR
jgi:hypothetical protein